ncbi:MAG TPA: nucleotide pyrophosphatase/phosphodiesterase family protein [Jiangellaceae bacterium]
MAEVVEPRYGDGSLTDILPSVLGALGVPGEENVLRLPPARRYCVLLIDGLGWHLLRSNPAAAPFLHSLDGRALTCGVPSTTATSLTSFGTGLPPGRHGVVGYSSRIPGTRSDLLNALKWSKSVDPATYQPYPSVFQRAAEAGVSPTVVGKREFRKSGLTGVALRPPSYQPAETLGERVARSVDALRPEPSLVYVYDGDLDYTGHQSGCGSAAWRYELMILDRFAEELYDALPAGTALVVTADHGMVDVPFENRIDVDDVPALREGVDLVAGEARFRHVYAAPGAADDVLAAWREVLGRRADVRARDDALAAGWFGAWEPRVHERIGDVVAAADAASAIERRSVFPVEKNLVGLHGALTADEMLIPLLTTTPE